LYGGLSLIYESLRRAGIKFDPKAIDAILPENLLRFRHPDGPQGHIESHYPLADLGTGASGHGLSAAGGIAVAHKTSGLDTKVFVFMGDAETEEGMSYEARNILNTMGIDNLIVSLDYNHFGIDGNINEVIVSPYINHWLGLGWNVIEVDGHNFEQLITAYQKAREGFGNSSPTVVLAHCIKGKYYGAKENTADSHGSPAKSEEYLDIMKKMGFEVTGKIEEDVKVVANAITPELAKYIAERLEVAKTKIKTETKNIELMKKSLGERPLVNPVEIRRPTELPAGLKFAEGTNVATRKATQAWFEWMMKQTAFFWAGAGDLSKSILIDKAEKVHGLITRENKCGRGIRFGIAEQNMAMLSCGMTQDRLPGGFAPVSAFSSYGVFTSMMSNAVRMALIGNALDPKRKGFFIMLAAHDGPETGEDGPTHQGLFWMSLYTAYPGIKVYKPMDANETIEMLFYALEKGEPVALSVARPDTIVFDRSNGMSKASDAVNGAYVFYKSSEPIANSSKARVVLVVAGGQTLVNTMEIVPELEEHGLSVKVVAVTSPELFEELRKNNPEKANEIFSDEDREHTIAIHNGWKGFLYPFLLPKDYTKRSIGIDRFLKSGSPKEVYELAGLRGEDIKKKILNAIK
jgi:transketolase